MAFYLSEAYSDLYNPRVESNLNDNLRFIDFMEEEDIEEVVESLVWEVCDYGNTLEESFKIISHAASDDIINEAYEELLSESRSQVMALRSQAQRGLQTQKAALQSDLRRKTRKSRVDGAISRVKSAISGSRGGMGRAAKNLGGAIAKARTDGKARLGQLLRRGIKATGRLIGSAGKKISQSGTTAASAPTKTKSYDVPLMGKVSVSKGPSEKTGKTRQKIGTAIRKAGAAVSRIGKEKPARMTRADYESRKAQRSAAARSSVSGSMSAHPAPPPSGRSSGSMRSAQPAVMAGKMEKPPLPPRPAGFNTKKPELGFKKLGGGEKSSWTPSAATHSARKRMGIGRPERPTGKKGQKLSGAALPPRGRLLGKPTREARKQLEEILQQISSIMVNEGYVDTIDSAYNVLDNLTDAEFWDLVEDCME